jgi:hypothetical protein
VAVVRRLVAYLAVAVARSLALVRHQIAGDELIPLVLGVLSAGRTFVFDNKIGGPCRIWVDAVEKGKNELTEIFSCVPVETDIS